MGDGLPDEAGGVMDPLSYDASWFTKKFDVTHPLGYRIELSNPPFPPVIDVSIELLESAGRLRDGALWMGSPHVEWIPGVSVRIRTDNGYDMSWQELERDEERGVIRFGVP